MDPIKVDFSKKDGGRKNDIVIPPERAALKIVLSVICTLVLAAVAYYLMLPAVNLKSYDFYIYLGIVAASYVVFNGLFANVLGKPEYMPYVKKRAVVPGIIIGALVAVVAVGFVVSSEFFRAESYSKIISVRTDGNFSEEIPEEDAESFSIIPKLDEDAAAQLASRALGNLQKEGYVSQFAVYPQYTQINYKDKPVRVAPLKYDNIIKWLTNMKNGLPGYVIIDMASESTEFKKTENGIKYSPSEHFNRLLKRHLRFEYPTYLFADATFEIDDEGTPYWICARLDKTIGLFGGTDVIGAVVVNSIDGTSQIISTSTNGKTKLPTDSFVTDDEWQWIDRIYSATILNEQYNYYGKLSHGFINSLIGQEGVKVTSSGYNYLALNDDVYMYTGVTSISSDQSIIGFVLLNQRTKETKYYPISGALENTAQTSAQGAVQQYSYTATFPLLLNISGEPTYFMALKDSSELVKMYAMVNVKQSTVVGIGSTLTECTENYADNLKKNGINLDINIDEIGENDQTQAQPETKEVSGTVTEIRSVVTGGETYFYIKLNTGNTFYKLGVKDAERVVILNVGDSVTFNVPVEASGDIITASSIK